MKVRTILALTLCLALATGCATPKKEPERELTPKEKQEQKINELEQTATSDPANAEAQYKYGNALFDAGRYPAAMQAFQKAISAKNDYAAAYCNMGLCLRVMGQIDEAIDAYEHALAIEPDDATTLTNLIAALRSKGDADTALEHLNRLADLRPNDVAIRSEIANILYKKGDYAGAEQRFKEVIALDPGMSSDYYNLGLCYIELDRLDEALTTWLTALAYDPKNASVRKGLAVLYWKRQEFEKAWQSVVDCQTRNIPLDPAFIENLQRDSGHAGPEASK